MPQTIQDIAATLRGTVQAALVELGKISEADSVQEWKPGGWTRREMMGHLIDSASNNHQRFVRAQGHDRLEFDGYDQDLWVSIQGYASAPWNELLTHWSAYNQHLARVMEATPEGDLTRPRHAHNLDQIAWQTVPKSKPVTLQYFMEDYVGHMRYHLGQLGVTLP